MGFGSASHLAGMVAQEEVGLDMALQIHLGSNRYPPMTFMAETCKAAIVAFEEDDPFRLIQFPQGIRHCKYGSLVPATEVVAEFRLGPFTPQDADY